MTRVKMWAEIEPEHQQKFRAYLDSDPTGQEIAKMTGGDGVDLDGVDLDHAIWLIYVELICWNKAGVSFLDLPDYRWGDDYEGGLTPMEALRKATAAAGGLRMP